MRISEFVLILLAGVLLGVFVGGCGDDDGECGECVRSTLRCAPDGTQVEFCVGSCWTTGQLCDTDKHCIDPEGEDEDPRCAVCEPTETRCSADQTKVEVCSDQEEWTDLKTCAGETVCLVENDVAECVVPCTNGATRCSADNRQVETCSDSQWTATATCTESQVCRVVGDAAQCVAADDACTADKEFAQRCNPDDDIWIQECRNVGTEETPKYEWGNIVDCSLGSADEVCVFDPDFGSLPICGLP